MGAPQLLEQALAARQKGDQQTAERLCEEALAQAPRAFDANHLLGVMRFQQGRNTEALVFLDTALAAAPGAGEAHAHRGLVLHALGRDADALASLEKAQAIRPGHAETLNWRGMVLQAMGRSEEALASLDAALTLRPHDGEALSNRALTLKALGRSEEALASLELAAKAEPGNPGVQFNRGLMLKEMGCRPEEAAEAFEAVLALLPGHVAALNNLALVLCECGRTEDAMRVFRRHAELVHVPDDPAAPDHKRRHDAEQRDYLALNLGPSPPAFHLQRGARLQGPAVNPGNDTAAIARHWRAARPQIVVIDDLLTGEALEGLRRFCRESTIWHKSYANGYLGAIPESGFACPLLAQIADELRHAHGAIFGTHPLRYLWAFKCDGTLHGVNIHADFAAVNVNFWITPDEANLDPEHGGLVIWDVAAPLDWDFDRYNNDETAIRGFLAAQNAKSVTVPYRANRAVIFDSDLFHETDKIAFRDGYENRRMNVTMLFGRRRAHEGPGSPQGRD